MPNTTMNSLRNSITEMGARIREAASALAVAANDESISMEEVQRQQAALRAMNERMNALQASYNAQFGENAGTLPTPLVVYVPPSTLTVPPPRSLRIAAEESPSVSTVRLLAMVVPPPVVWMPPELRSVVWMAESEMVTVVPSP